MKNPYKVLCSDDQKLKNFEYSYTTGDERYYWVLVKVDENDNVIEIVGNDCCEPEDALLVRDFSWVENALNEQYNYYENLIEKIKSKE